MAYKTPEARIVELEEKVKLLEGQMQELIKFCRTLGIKLVELQ